MEQAKDWLRERGGKGTISVWYRRISTAWRMAKRTEWTDAGQADVRRIDRESAVRIPAPNSTGFAWGDNGVRFHDLGKPSRSYPCGIGGKRTGNGGGMLELKKGRSELLSESMTSARETRIK